MNADDEKYMLDALRLARGGIGYVEPNPAVGCVIVRDGQVIGKGFHGKFGAAHAEINALTDCRQAGFSPEGATMYVSLEPCCHIGKTPPCCDAIIAAGIARVVVAAADVSEKVSGKGLESLKKAGLNVDVGLCEKEAQTLNAWFFKFSRTGLPWVIVKWAQSSDGFLSRRDGVRWISNVSSRDDSQMLRRRAQAILVGINTVREDDPLLTRRPAREPGLIRVVLDSNLGIALSSRLLGTIADGPVMIFTLKKTLAERGEKAAQIKKIGAEIAVVDAAAGRCDIKEVVRTLGQRGVGLLLVEGGREVIDGFLEAGLVDEAVIYQSTEKLGKFGDTAISERMRLLLKKLLRKGLSEKLDGDERISGLCR